MAPEGQTFSLENVLSPFIRCIQHVQSVASSFAKWHECGFFITIKGLDKYFSLGTGMVNFKSRYSFEVAF